MTIPEGEALDRELKEAYRVYQRNIRAVDQLVYQITRGARDGVPERELLQLALQALEKCTIPGPPPADR